MIICLRDAIIDAHESCTRTEPHPGETPLTHVTRGQQRPAATAVMRGSAPSGVSGSAQPMGKLRKCEKKVLQRLAKSKMHRDTHHTHTAKRMHRTYR